LEARLPEYSNDFNNAETTLVTLPNAKEFNPDQPDEAKKPLEMPPCHPNMPLPHILDRIAHLSRRIPPHVRSIIFRKITIYS
jgi:hypothetical protein